MVTQHIFQYLFRGLPVTLIHGKEEKRHHNPDHQENRRRISNDCPCQEIYRKPDCPGNAEKNELSFRKIEGDLCLYLCKIFRYGYIWQSITPFKISPRCCTLRAGSFILKILSVVSTYFFIYRRWLFPAILFVYFLSCFLQTLSQRNRFTLNKKFRTFWNRCNFFLNPIVQNRI